MAARRRRGALAGALLLLMAATAASADDIVACHLSYAGTERTIEARPTASPYTVAPVEFGSYLLFRVVFRTEPADLASIKLYTYAQHDDVDGRALIHQATYAYPPTAGRAYGFSGLNHVYEPCYGLVLDYWCEAISK